MGVAARGNAIVVPTAPTVWREAKRSQAKRLKGAYTAYSSGRHTLSDVSVRSTGWSISTLRRRYETFLKERNEQGQFSHRRLRSALRSLRSNAPWLFTHLRYPDFNIPTTTNSCDGSFVHWKAKVKIHRGLRQDRRSKIIRFLLTQS